MSNNTSSSSSGGIGFCGLLTIVLIVLKLLGKISISWLWVFSPMWVGLLVGIAFILIVLLSALGLAAVVAFFGKE